MNFSEKLMSAVRKNNSLLCVGLDPDLSMIPSEQVVAFNERIIDATIDLVCAYKPNLAIYESMGTEGLAALKKTLAYIRKVDSDVPIIGDGKRGDIGLCSLAYTRTMFDTYEFDAVTVNPYMGSDAIKPFIDRKDKGVFVLCRTSNPSGADVQELKVVQGDNSITRPLYEIIAELALSWNKSGNVGLVVGATYPEEIHRIRQICPNMLFLIPGVGWQGGNVAKTVRSAVDAEGGGFIINVSRQIMYATKTSKGTQSVHDEAVRKMRHVALQLRKEIDSYLPKPSKESQKQVHSGNREKTKRNLLSKEESVPLVSMRDR